jgi:hypothetical protein
VIHTIILLVLVYAAIKAALRAIFKRKPYQIQLVSAPPAARDSGSTNRDALNDRIAEIHDAAGCIAATPENPAGLFESVEQYRRRTRVREPERPAPDFTDSHLWI